MRVDTTTPERTRARWNPLIIVFYVGVHSLAVSAFFLPIRWWYVPAAIGVYLAIGLCTTVGLHRLLSHRSFRCPKWVEYALVSVAMVTGQGSPLLWAATHRQHHADPDGPHDIHSPRRGFWYSHIGWIVDDTSTDRDAWRTVCRDLAPSRYYLWLVKYRLVPQAIAVALVGFAAGWAAVPFLFYLPAVCWMQATYCINSVCHTRSLGSRTYDTPDDSRNVWWCGLLLLGEGWHNNHHAFPRSAYHGLKATQPDLSGLFIRALAAVGLAWDVHAADGVYRRRREES